MLEDVGNYGFTSEIVHRVFGKQNILDSRFTILLDKMKVIHGLLYVRPGLTDDLTVKWED